MARFSVVIPSFNSAPVAGRAIESVLSQTCRDFDVVVVDDGSADSTADVLRSYRGRIQCIHQANSGAAAARNRGIAASDGQYVAFLDADDIWYPHKLGEIEKAIAAHPGAGLFYSDYKAVTGEGRPLRVERCRHVVGQGYGFLLLHNFMQTSTVVCKRECFDACGLFHEAFRRREDWDMWLRIARRFSLVHVPSVLGEYTLEPLRQDCSCIETLEHRQIIDRAFLADSTLSPGRRRQVQARLAYMEGVAHLRYGRVNEALRCMRDSIRGEPLRLRTHVYWALAAGGLATHLPRWLRIRLRLV
jgi:glycosyltransferase involved in cell wall biosynthesis